VFVKQKQSHRMQNLFRPLPGQVRVDTCSLQWLVKSQDVLCGFSHLCSWLRL